MGLGPLPVSLCPRFPCPVSVCLVPLGGLPPWFAFRVERRTRPVHCATLATTLRHPWNVREVGFRAPKGRPRRNDPRCARLQHRAARTVLPSLLPFVP